MEDPYSQLEPENFAGIWALIVIGSALIVAIMTANATVAIVVATAGLLLPLAGWLGKTIFDAVFDDPITRGFFAPINRKLYAVFFPFGLWFLIGASTFPVARQADIAKLWLVFILATLPALFVAFYLFRGIRAHLLAKDWRNAARQMDLKAGVDPDSSRPRMHGEYLGRPVKVTVEKEANSHFTAAQAKLGESSHGVEIASSESLYFRPHEGTVIGDSEPGAPEFRIYGVSKELAKDLATSELLRKLQILEWMTEEMRIGPETTYARYKGATLGISQLVHLTSTLAEIADIIDEANATPAAPA